MEKKGEKGKYYGEQRLKKEELGERSRRERNRKIQEALEVGEKNKGNKKKT